MEVEAQKGSVTGPRSHSSYVKVLCPRAMLSGDLDGLAQSDIGEHHATGDWRTESVPGRSGSATGTEPMPRHAHSLRTGVLSSTARKALGRQLGSIHLCSRGERK